MITRITNLFWLWTLIGVSWAWFTPQHFIWFAPYITPTLGGIMLGMGITLSWQDFRRVFQHPKGVFLGVIAQFLIMPSLGYFIAKIFNLEPGLAAGLILVSCCPGGTASNVIAYLSKGNVSLSVLMTMTSTFLAILLTPYLTGWLAGTYIPINEVVLLKQTISIVLVPILAGIVINQYTPRFTTKISHISPLLSAIAIIMIVGCVIALKKEAIITAGAPLIFAVLTLHTLAFFLGFIFAKTCGCHPQDCRTVCIEVGMQNSGLGASLATTLPNPLAPVPSAISALFHCLIGSLLAGIWRNRS